MISSRGKVPNFSLKPHPVVIGLILLVVIVGLLSALSFYTKEDGTGVYAPKGHFALIVTGVITICLLIVATSKMWFTHLWKKNSSHSRHKEHSPHHPIHRERRNRRR